jgi:hypothetical protein
MSPLGSIQEGGCTTPPRLQIPPLRGAASLAKSLSPAFLVFAVLIIGPLTYIGGIFGASAGVMGVHALGHPHLETIGLVLGSILGAAVPLLGGGFVASRLSRKLASKWHRRTTESAPVRRG